MVWRLGFKASNGTALRFQSALADEVLSALRKHGQYIARKPGNNGITMRQLAAYYVLKGPRMVDYVKRRDKKQALITAANAEAERAIAKVKELYDKPGDKELEREYQLTSSIMENDAPPPELWTSPKRLEEAA